MTKNNANAEEKTRAGGRWTEGRYRGFITSVLRSGMRRWAPKYDVLKQAYVTTKINKVSKRMAKHYKCAICGKLFTSTNIQVDHKIPIGHCESWDEFVEKLYCEDNNLQVICKPDHKKKTKKEQGTK